MAGTNGQHPKPIRLSDLVKTTVPPLELPSGQVVECRKLNWAGWDVVSRMEQNNASIAEIYETAGFVLNGDLEAAKALSLEEACVVIAHASKSVEQVASDPPPNSAGEATNVPAAVPSPSSA